MVECDDGNNFDGDGCSADCKVESGYRCTNRAAQGLPDLCVDVVSPTAELHIAKGNILQVQFSELVVSVLAGNFAGESEMIEEKLNATIAVRLEGAKAGCGEDIKWGIVGFQRKFKVLLIQVAVPCSLHGNAEEFYVTFEKPKAICDLSGNPLSVSELHALAKRYVYIDSSMEAAVGGTGSAFTAASMAALGFALGMNLFQSSVTSTFWVFMDLLQMLSYLPLIDLEMPDNLELFLTEYMTVGSLTVPFQILPSWVPNPANFLTDFAGEMLDSRFITCGYESMSFVYNMSDTLFTWVLLLGLYLFLRAMAACLPRKRYPCLSDSTRVGSGSSADGGRSTSTMR